MQLKYWAVVLLAIAVFVMPTSAAVTRYNTTVGTDTLAIFNGTGGATTWLCPQGVSKVWYTIVGGGGGGGSQEGGGGGAGSFMNGSVTVSPGTTYNLVLGGGGAGATALTGLAGRNGGNSSFMNTTVGNGLNAWGGGGGGSGDAGAAGSGGSGGGGSFAVTAGGTALQGAAFGKNGGAGTTVANYGSGGGGGATSVGGNGSTTNSGNGGNGNTSAINGTTVTFAAGGGGGAYTGATRGLGGSSIGGDGGTSSSAGNNAVAQTGSGGGGGGNSGGTSYSGGNGAAGIVMLRYYVPVPLAQFTATPTSGQVPLAVSFTDGTVLTPTSWNWSFTPVQGGNYSASQNPSFTFVNPGTYNVNLSVTNASGWNSTIRTITATNAAVGVASFTQNRTVGTAPLTVQFNDTSTGYGISAWSWRYLVGGVGPTVFSTQRNASYTFTSPGTYYITLAVTNSGGTNTTPVATAITVNGIGAPTVNFSWDPSTGTPGVLVRFTDLTTGYGGALNTTDLAYLWDFGDVASLEPTSTTIGDVAHVYNYGGVYHVNLSVTNANGTDFKYYSEAVIVSTSQSTSNWYSPHQVRLRVMDQNDQIQTNANVTAIAYESSLPGGFNGAAAVLQQMYGINNIQAAQMVNGATQMQGITGTDGAIIFTMHGSLKYLITVVNGGDTFTKTLYPLENAYLVRVQTSTYTPPQDKPSRYDDVGNGTALLTFAEPNMSYMTLGLDYRDNSSATTSITFKVKLLNNGTEMYTNTKAVAGTQHILTNYTVPNVRGQRWVWYYNATVVT